jgi:hypothetical protein
LDLGQLNPRLLGVVTGKRLAAGPKIGEILSILPSISLGKTRATL